MPGISEVSELKHLKRREVSGWGLHNSHRIAWARHHYDEVLSRPITKKKISETELLRAEISRLSRQNYQLVQFVAQMADATHQLAAAANAESHSTRASAQLDEALDRLAGKAVELPKVEFSSAELQAIFADD